MNEKAMTKEQLVNELVAARKRISELEASEAKLKQAEDALQNSRQLLQLIMDNIPMAVFWKDKDLVFLGCNRNFVEDAGLASADDIVGRTDFDMPWAEQAEFFRTDDQLVMDTGESKLNYEEPQIGPDGKTTWLRTSKVPLYDAAGAVVAVLGVYEDITESKQKEAERERLRQDVIDAQRQALQELSTPIIPLMDQIIVMPLIGSIDSMRARDITRALLAGINAQHAKVVILDITGVPLVDSGVASHLNKTIQAARLKGARTIITGISDAVAETIVDLGIDWRGVETLSNLQTGLRVALRSLGVKLTRHS